VFFFPESMHGTTGRNPTGYWKRTGGRGSHRRTAEVDGEAAAGSQEGTAAPGGVSSPRGVVPCGGPDVFSDGGAPRHGSTATFSGELCAGKRTGGVR
jgi:hypothetical protein